MGENAFVPICLHLHFVPLLLITANVSYFRGERHLMLSRDVHSAPSTAEKFKYSLSSTHDALDCDDTRAHTVRAQLPTSRLCRDSRVSSQRKRHLDR